MLRKDFTVGPHDVCDARLMGADCVLLIAAALDDTELATLHDLAVEVGIDALVEVHDEAEVERALAVGATLVGVNQRDLVTFEVDTERAVRVAPRMPDERGAGGRVGHPRPGRRRPPGRRRLPRRAGGRVARDLRRPGGGRVARPHGRLGRYRTPYDRPPPRSSS